MPVLMSRITKASATRPLAVAALCAGLFGMSSSAEAGLLDMLFGQRQPQPVVPQYYAPPTYAPRYYNPLYGAPRGLPRQTRLMSLDPVRPRKHAARPGGRDLVINPAKVGVLCCKNGEDPMMALMSDPTLRSGDVVMTTTGLRIFSGAHGGGHETADFLAIESARKLNSRDKAILLAIDQASRIAPPWSPSPAPAQLAHAARKEPARLASRSRQTD